MQRRGLKVKTWTFRLRSRNKIICFSCTLRLDEILLDQYVSSLPTWQNYNPTYLTSCWFWSHQNNCFLRHLPLHSCYFSCFLTGCVLRSENRSFPAKLHSRLDLSTINRLFMIIRTTWRHKTNLLWVMLSQSIFIRLLRGSFGPVPSRTHAFVFAQDAGVDTRQGAHAALVARSKSRVLELQLVVAWHLDERTPAENLLESGPEPAARNKPGLSAGLNAEV